MLAPIYAHTYIHTHMDSARMYTQISLLLFKLFVNFSLCPMLSLHNNLKNTFDKNNKQK